MDLDLDQGVDPEASRDDPSRSDAQLELLAKLNVKGVVHLQCPRNREVSDFSSDDALSICHVYLIGTAHVSQESCSEVKAVISCLKPEAVFLELCHSRLNILTPPQPQHLKVPTAAEMFHMWKHEKANPFGILYSCFLAKVASQLDVLPGAEFRVAYEEAIAYGARVILGDRPVQITLRRTWGAMTTWHKIKFLYHIIFQSVFLPSSDEIAKMLKEMEDGDALTVLVQEMSKAFPSLMETLIVERDKYMSQALWNVAREHSSVVAVVGKGHLSGIKKYWMQPVEVESLLQVPAAKKGKGVGVFKIVAVTGVVVASAVFLWSKK